MKKQYLIPDIKKALVIFSSLFGFLSLYAQYTLSDEDVTMSSGRIMTCSYNFAIKNIIIPDTLDNQAVKSILTKGSGQLGVFAGKGITRIELPPTLTYIGGNAFMGNELDTIIFTSEANLESIGDYAFSNNKFTSLNLSHWPRLKSIGDDAFSANQLESVNFTHDSLIRIGHGAFRNNDLAIVDFSDCKVLSQIGNYSFFNNKISAVNFSNCTALNWIGVDAFRANNLSEVDFSDCSELVIIRENAFIENTSLTSFTLPTIADNKFENWIDENGTVLADNAVITDFSKMYNAVIPYTLKDDDVLMSGNWIGVVTLDSKYTHITIPSVLDGKEVQYTANITPGYSSNLNYIGVFGNRNIVSIKFPATMIQIGTNAFRNNPVIDLDFSDCKNLRTINKDAFYNNKLSEIVLSPCVNLTTIMNYAFKNDKLTEYDLPVLDTTNFTFIHWYENSATETPHVGPAKISSAYMAKYLWKPDITFIVTSDGSDRIEGATVILNNFDTLITNEKGEVYFNNTPSNSSFSYKVTKPNYSYENGSFETTTYNRTITCYIQPLGEVVVFNVSNGKDQVEGATVKLDNYGEVLTDTSGRAIFPNVMADTTIKFSVSKTGYYFSSGTISVESDSITKNITLDFITYDITFIVSNAETEIEGAIVELEGYKNFKTDNNGVVVFKEVLPAKDISYSISAQGHESKVDSLTITDKNLTEKVTLNKIPTSSLEDIYPEENISIFPNPASTMLIIKNPAQQEISIFTINGNLKKRIENPDYEQIINASTFENGTYIIHIGEETFTITICR